MDNATSKSGSDNAAPTSSGRLPMSNYTLLARVSKFLNNATLKQFLSVSMVTNEPSRPELMAREFLQCVAYGQQDKAEEIIKLHAQQDIPQWILTVRAAVTDYSGRTFTCSAYEYAYWAKDTHMCRMLEKYMDKATKTVMLERIDAMERDGLTYQQHGKTIAGSSHFSLTTLITAYNTYIQACDGENIKNEVIKAWMAVGMAQRDVPVHVMNEYCRQDRSFVPDPPLKLEFNEATLPRVLTFYNSKTRKANAAAFPLEVSGTSGLGFDFALFRGLMPRRALGLAERGGRADLAAISLLDEVRTADLTQSRENLRPIPSPHLGM